MKRLILLFAMACGASNDALAQDLSGRFRTVLWAACTGDSAGASTDSGAITLHDIALRARPALWFSRDEPLIEVDGPLPREWPRRQSSEATPEDVVYYRVTQIKSTSSDHDLVRAFQKRMPADLRGYISAQRANPEAIAQVPLDAGLVGQLQELIVRYLFYYPNELGAHSHAHDLESIELRIVVEDADERGDPGAANRPCRQIRVATLYGAAHGLGLYTNVLDLDIVMRDRLNDTSLIEESTSRRTSVPAGGGGVAIPAAVTREPLTIGERLSRSDPFWPLIVLVEEGKHASAPDRNGDGMFTLNYDVNRFAADAWGARDTMRSRQLSPVFRADTFKRRVPEIAVDDTGALRHAQLDDSWAQQAFSRYIRYDYRLRRATEDREICGDPLRDREDRRASMEQYAEELTEQLGGHPGRLLGGKGFCEDVTVHGRVNVTDVLERVGFGGAYNGFTHWWERVSVSGRFDGGRGWAATVPFGVQVPGLGGWMVARVSQPWQKDNSRKSVDVVYMPSASRFADWYTAVGVDYGRLQSESELEEGQRFAVETGLKFRFPLPDLGTFFGGRIGIRANGKAPLERLRLVFEVGAGIW